MSVVRLCNRCQAPTRPLDATPRLVVVPAASPSKNPVAQAGDFPIGLATGLDADQQPIDYCPLCLLSVVMARVLPMAPAATAQAAIETITKARAVVADVTPTVSA